MTATLPEPAATPLRSILYRTTLPALLFLFFATAFLALTAWSYHHATLDPHRQTRFLSLCIAASFLATLSLALTMRILDHPLTKRPLPLYIRLPLKLHKRILLLAQLLTTATTIAAAYFLAFHFKLPSL